MSVETRFRIVSDVTRPPNKDGRFPWQCTLCGASVAHIDRHAEWHLRAHDIVYNAPIRTIDGDPTWTIEDGAS